MGRQRIAMSRVAADAARILGQQIQLARHDRNWTAAELADRASVSARTVAAIEAGEPSVSVGNAFNVAAAIGIPLFNLSTPPELAHARRMGEERLALLPTRVHHRNGDKGVDLDF